MGEWWRRPFRKRACGGRGGHFCRLCVMRRTPDMETFGTGIRFLVDSPPPGLPCFLRLSLPLCKPLALRDCCSLPVSTHPDVVRSAAWASPYLHGSGERFF